MPAVEVESLGTGTTLIRPTYVMESVRVTEGLPKTAKCKTASDPEVTDVEPDEVSPTEDDREVG